MELVGIEDDERPLPARVFQKMIRFYRQTESILLLPNPPKRDPLPQDFRTAARATLSLSPETLHSIREARRIQHFVTDLRAVDREIIAHADIGRAALGDDAEKAAAEERRQFGVTVQMQRDWAPYGAFSEWRNRMQAMGILVLLKRMPWRDCRGLSLSDENLVPAIVVNSEDRPNARTFTLFHEYAHLMLRQSGVCVQQDQGASNKEQVERWCNTFAAAFLVPAEDLRQSVEARFARLERRDWTINHIKRLASDFRVSRYVVARRLKELNISDFYDEHSEQLRQYDRSPPPPERASTKRPRGWQTTQKLSEIGQVAADVILDGVRSQIADAVDAADLLGLRVNQLRELDEKSVASRA